MLVRIINVHIGNKIHKVPVRHKSDPLSIARTKVQTILTKGFKYNSGQIEVWIPTHMIKKVTIGKETEE